MQDNFDFNAWFNVLRGDDTQAVAAKKSSLNESTLSRQLSRGTMRPEMVIALCRGYGRSPVTGLIETGYLQKWETEGVSIPYALEQATNQQILKEIMRRSDPEARELFGGQGHENEVIGLAPVQDLPTPDSNTTTPVSDPSDNHKYDGTVREFDWDETQYAADSSIEENEERLQRGEDLID